MKPMRRLWAGALALAVYLCGCGGAAQESAAPTETLSPEDRAAVEQAGGPDREAQAAATPEPTEDMSDRTVITVGTYGERLSVSSVVLEQFYNSQDAYVLEIVDYSQGHTLSHDQAIMQLNADLAAGNGPDILYCMKLRIDPAVYGAKGYLEDLYPYLDADPEIGREDIRPSILRSYEIDGALYQTLPSFGIAALATSKSIAEEIDSWTFADFMAYASEHGGAGAMLGRLRFQDLTGGGAEVSFETVTDPNYLLEHVVTNYPSEFVDPVAGTASFDTEYFQQVLEFCGEMDDSPAESEALPPFWPVNLKTFMEVQYFEALFGEEVVFLGYPSPENGTNYCVDVLDGLSINAFSENKEGAWAFLRIFFTEEYGTRVYNQGFPSNPSAMEGYIEHSMTTIMDEGADGELVERTNRGEVYGFEYHAATEEQVEKVLALIDSAAGYNAFLGSGEIKDIVLEEAAYYFSGDKSAAEVCALIQNRVSLYLAEQG